MPAALTRRRIILNVEPPNPGDHYTTATIPDDDGDGSIDWPVLHLDTPSWRDMGSPHTITLTIEPGDHLNPETT